MAVKKAVAKGKGKKEEVKPVAKAKGKKEETKPVAKGKTKPEVKETKKPAAKAKGKATGGAKRGRVAGVRSEVNKKDADLIQKEFSVIEAEFTVLADNIDKFLTGNKASVGKARKNIQIISRVGKGLRKILQDSKLNMKQVKI